MLKLSLSSGAKVTLHDGARGAMPNKQYSSTTSCMLSSLATRNNRLLLAWSLALSVDGRLSGLGIEPVQVRLESPAM